MQKEREISFIEILIAVLKKWKLIVILAVIFAIVLGGYKFISNYGAEIPAPSAANKKAAGENELTYEEYTELLRLNKQNSEFNKKSLKQKEARLEDLEKYAETSHLMQIDPFNCACASRTCIVYGGSQNTEAVAINLVSDLRSIDYKLAGVARGTELEDLDTPYLRELISINMPMDSFQVDTPRFTVSVIAKDKNTASTILKNIIAVMADFQYDINEFADASFYSIKWTSDQNYTYYDSDLQKTQASTYDSILDFADQINKTQAAIDSLEKEYDKIIEDGYTEKEEAAGSTTVSFAAAAKSSVKFAAVGFVLGAIIGIAIAFCQVFFSPNLYHSRQLQDDADLKFIGSIENTDSVKGLQKLLKRISGDKEFLSPSLERTAYTAARLVPLAKDGKILVTGTADTADIEKAIAALKNAEPSLNLVFKGNLTVSSAAVKELEDAVGILVMERTDKSKLKLISSLLEVCRFTGKDIIGYITI